MIGVDADGADGLFEREFNFEAQAVEANDFQRIQVEIRA